MQNYKDLVLEKEIGNIEMIRPIKGISMIQENPIDVLEKLGKYEFIYDYQVSSFSWQNLLLPLQSSFNSAPPSIYKEGGSNANMIAPIWSGQSSTQPVKVNSEPQVGAFSKGNIVNVLRFDGNNAIIQNPNFLEPAPDAPKSFWSSLLQNPKEFIVPKEYLQKVDDNTPMTMQLGSNFGSNPKPQPIGVKPIIKDLPQPSSDVILEENATFVLNKDFQYISGYGSSYCSPDGICTMDMSPKYSVLKAGTKVTGRLFKSITNEKVLKTIADVRDSMIRPTVIEQNFLAVKGYGNTGSINIPIEYLTRDVATTTTTTNNNNGNVVPVTNDNKNLLMIVGAFLVGYVLFSKEKASS